MTSIAGLHGLRPRDSVAAERLTAPPYDVIKPGSGLERLLQARAENLWHITLGQDPLAALGRLRGGVLIEDGEPCYWLYEQRWSQAGKAMERIGFFAAVAVSGYDQGQVIRHEKTFDDKVQGRLDLTRKTGLTLEPVFLLTRSPVTAVCRRLLAASPATYVFTSDFAGESELSGIANRFLRVPAASEEGLELQSLVARHPLYIADGHHRYHAALKNGQTHCMAYVVEQAAIQAYNRVVRGNRPFAQIRDRLALEPAPAFATPPKHAFCLYHQGRSWLLRASQVPQDAVGRLDCSILERELYPLLGIEHAMIKDPRHFDYYPEQDLVRMTEAVDTGRYDLAIALHPVSIDELVAVADAGLADGGRTVMPEKSTFFAPKILSGIMLYRHHC